MCGRYGLISSDKDVIERFEVENKDFDLNERYNVAPTQKMPVIEKHSPNSLHMINWGIQPSWSKMFLINAQASKLPTSGLWKKAFLERRCIVPADFFYEWKRLEDGKQPYLIRLKSKEIMGFAGIVIDYKDKGGKDQEGYVIITTEPNSLMEKIHNRMPVILKKEDEEAWLNPDETEPERLEKLLNPYNADEMEAYPISSLVNKPSIDAPELIKPVKI